MKRRTGPAYAIRRGDGTVDTLFERTFAEAMARLGKVQESDPKAELGRLDHGPAGTFTPLARREA